MAIYHCSIKIISRGKGKSAVAAAAYRAGELIKNEYDGIVHDYTRKGGIVHTEILLPENALEEYTDRTILWNAVEKIEKAKNSQLAREIELALPKELSMEQNISLVREYVKSNFVDKGMCADICIHDKNDGNPHAHIMLTMRPFNEDKSWGDKQKKEYILDGRGNKIYDPKKRQYRCKSVPTTDWSEQTKAEEWRAAWANAVNAVLERETISESVDHRSYARQGIEQVPTVHMGVAATQMERRGIVTDRGNTNRIIVGINQKLRQLWEQIIQLKDWLKEENNKTAEPSFLYVLELIFERCKKGIGVGKIRNADMVERVIDFMKENDISTLPEIMDKVKETVTDYDNARENLILYERSIERLDEHIKQGAVYLKHKNIYAQYMQLKPRKQEKFFEAHRVNLMMFQSAQRYFKEHHIKSDFSVNDWKTERAELINGRSKAYREYCSLKTQFDNVYNVRRAAEQIARELNPQPQRDVRRKMWER